MTIRAGVSTSPELGAQPPRSGPSSGFKAQLGEYIGPDLAVVVVGAAVDENRLKMGQVRRIEELGQDVGERGLSNASLTVDGDVLAPLGDRIATSWI